MDGQLARSRQSLSLSLQEETELSSELIEQSTPIELNITVLSKALIYAEKTLAQILSEEIEINLSDILSESDPNPFSPEGSAQRIAHAINVSFRASPLLQGDSHELDRFYGRVHYALEKSLDHIHQELLQLGAYRFRGVRQTIERVLQLIKTKVEINETLRRAQRAIEEQVEELRSQQIG